MYYYYFSITFTITITIIITIIITTINITTIIIIIKIISLITSPRILKVNITEEFHITQPLYLPPPHPTPDSPHH